MRTGAKQDSQISNALIAAQLDIQKAGYGVEAASNSCLGATTPGPSAKANTHLVLISSAALATPLPAASSTLSGTGETIGASGATAVTGSALVWHWVQPGDSGNPDANLCSGLVVVPKDPQNPALGTGLVRLAGTNCTVPSNGGTPWWSTQTWSMETLIEPGSLPSGKAITFSAERGSCVPFGAGTPTSAVLVTITGDNSTGALTSSTTLCLPNICQ